MALKIKAKEKFLKLGKDAVGEWRFVLTTDLYGRLNEQKVLKEASLRSGISRGAIQAAWDACGEVIRAWATEGHSVAVPGLGTMRFGVRGSSVNDVSKISTGLITMRKVIFTPNVEIKAELSKTPIMITVLDRTGKELKRIASRDSGEVEENDPELNSKTEADKDKDGIPDSQEGNPNGGQGGNPSGNQGDHPVSNPSGNQGGKQEGTQVNPKDQNHDGKLGVTPDPTL